MYKPTRKFQSDMDREQARRRRENNALSLRRKDRENKLQNKRKKFMESKRNNNVSNDNIEILKFDSELRQSLQELPLYVKGCFTDNKATWFECTSKIRKILSHSESKFTELAIKLVIESGVIPRIIQFLHFSDLPYLQFEAMWVLTNISSSSKPEYTANIVNKGCLPLFIKILKESQLYQLQEQAMWALGNIAGDCIQLRNLVLSGNILPIIENIVKEEYNQNKVKYFNKDDEKKIPPKLQYLTFLDNIAWTLSNLSRGNGKDNKALFENENYKYQIIHCLYILMVNTTKFYSNINNTNNVHPKIIEMKSDIYISIGWGINYILEKENFDGDNKLLNWMNDNNILKGLIVTAKCDEYNPGALRAIGTILSGSKEEYTSLCINLGCIDAYKHNLNLVYETIMMNNNVQYIDKSKFKPIQEICWAISNITAGTKEQIESIFKAQLFPILIQILQITPYSCSKESMWAISNATECKERYIISYLCKINLIPSICSFLNKFIINDHFNTKSGEYLLNNALLLCIENILLLDDNGKYVKQFEEGNCYDYLEVISTVSYNDTGINNKIDHILQTYFDDDEMNQSDHDNDNNAINNISFQGQNNNNNNNNNGNNSNMDSRQFGNQFGFGYQGQINNNNHNDDNDNDNDQPFNF